MLYNKKVLILILLFLFSTPITFACSIEDSNSCDFTTIDALNEFRVNIDGIEGYKSISAHLKSSSGEIIPMYISKEETGFVTFEQEYKLNSQGIYEINFDAVLKDGISTFTKQYSLLYFFSNNPPPVILSITESGSDLTFDGMVNYKQEGDVIEVYKDSALIETITLSSTSFQSVIPIENAQHLFEFIHKSNGETSSPYRYIYTDKSEVVFTDIAKVTSVDFIDEHAINVLENEGKIITHSPIYLIQGEAENGDYVFVQSMPVPVIDNKFQTFIMPNEGNHMLCVEGEEEICINEFVAVFTYSPLTDFTIKRDLSVDKLIFLDEDDSINSKDKLNYLKANGNLVNTNEVDISTQSLNRNLHIVDFSYPGGYENVYLFQDLTVPSIEIIVPNEIYKSTPLVVKVYDDVSINFSSLNIEYSPLFSPLTIENLSTRIEDTGSSYLYFNIPNNVEISTPTIFASIQDDSGKSSSISKTIDLINTNLDLNLEVIGSEIIGSNLFISELGNTIITLKVQDESLDELPIVLGSLNQETQDVISYQNIDNIITITIDNSKVIKNKLQNLNFEILKYNDDSSFTSYNLDFEVVSDVESELFFASQDFVVIESIIERDIIIVKKLNPTISNIRIDGAQISSETGDYLFLFNGDENSIINIFYDKGFNAIVSDSYQIEIYNDTNTLSLSNSPSIDYSTYTISNNGLYSKEFDSISSQRYNGEIYSFISKPITQNIGFIEGLSKQEVSIFNYNSQNAEIYFLQNALIDSFTNYPNKNEEFDLVEFRGLRSYFNSENYFIQGRVIQENVSQVKFQDSSCIFNDLTYTFICQADLSRNIDGELIELIYDDGSSSNQPYSRISVNNEVSAIVSGGKFKLQNGEIEIFNSYVTVESGVALSVDGVKIFHTSPTTYSLDSEIFVTEDNLVVEFDNTNVDFADFTYYFKDNVDIRIYNSSITPIDDGGGDPDDDPVIIPIEGGDEDNNSGIIIEEFSQITFRGGNIDASGASVVKTTSSPITIYDDKDQVIINNLNATTSNTISSITGPISVVLQDGEILIDGRDMRISGESVLLEGSYDDLITFLIEDGTLDVESGTLTVDGDTNPLEISGGDILVKNSVVEIEDGGIVVPIPDEIPDGNDEVDIINENQENKSKLFLNLSKNPNVHVALDGFTFSSGGLILTYVPNIDGTHIAYINGNPKIFNVDASEIQIELDKELNEFDLNAQGRDKKEIEIYFEDSVTKESEIVEVIYNRLLDIIVNIFVS